MELEPKYQMDPAALQLLYVRASGGQLVPLDALATLTKGLGPLTVNHMGQLPGVTISFNLKEGTALGDAVAGVEKMARQMLPATITTNFQGAAQAFQASTQGLWLLLIMCILVIYLILGILYESFIHPITILSGLPSAGVGALLALMLFHMDLNIYAFVGIIMLVGIVKKNAIMMIDFALEAQRQRQEPPGGHLCRGPGPLPAHHDDHHGGPHGRPAHRPGVRRRGRSPPAPGHLRGGRPAHLPTPHPLYHPGLLPLHGILPEEDGRQVQEKALSPNHSSPGLSLSSGCCRLKRGIAVRAIIYQIGLFRFAT